MGQVIIKRAIVENILLKIRKEAIDKKKSIDTIDPILKIIRKLYPYLSDRELLDYAALTLRIVLNGGETNPYQTTLVSY